jgi:hypothetical protein
MSQTASWSDLPDDIVGEILAKLSLFELARVSLTCSSFHAVYRRLMAREQTSRCEMAIASCGVKRVRSLVAFLAHLLKGEPLNSVFLEREWNHCVITADGVMHGPWPTSRVKDIDIAHLFNSENMVVKVCPNRGRRDCTHGILIRGPNWCWHNLTVQLNSNGKDAQFDVIPLSDADVTAVALLQAVMAEGLAQSIHDARKLVDICVRRSADRHQFTRAGLKAQILPLLPMSSCYTPVDRVWEGFEIIQECMQIGRVVSAGDANVSLTLKTVPSPQIITTRPALQHGRIKRLLKSGRSLAWKLFRFYNKRR